MLIRPIRLSRSLGLAWAYAGQQVRHVFDLLDLGPVAVRAFLPHGACRLLDRELKRLETLVRRVLFLVAMETPLPALRQAGQGPATPPVPPADKQARPAFTVPAFRLTDPAGRRAPAPTVEQAERFGPPDPLARPLQPHDLVPSAHLFDRLVALQGALADPEGQVARFRRKLARIRADKALPLPVADTPPDACIAPAVPPVVRELFWTLHDAALSWLPFLDPGLDSG